MKAFFAALILMVCGVQAIAAPMEATFVADNGKVFQIAHVLIVEGVAGGVAVKQLSGSVETFPDATGAVLAKIKTNAHFQANYVQAPGTNKFVNTSLMSSAVCQSTGTTIGWPFAIGVSDFNDGCQLHTLIKASSN